MSPVTLQAQLLHSGRIRGRLDITVEPENFDTLAGVTGPHHQVHHS
jgi:hypothetical protein